MNLMAAKLFLKEQAEEGCSENIAFRCEVSQRLEDAGDYQAAAEVLGARWRGPGTRPDLRGLTEKEAGLLLLRAGMLSHRIAVTDPKPGAQDQSKELLDEAARMFRAMRDSKRESEALLGVGLCYWRLTAVDEARIVLTEALTRASVVPGQLKAAILLARGCVEWSDGAHEEAVCLYRECEPLVAKFGSHRLKAGFHCAMALARRRTGELDAALIEDAAASYHLERAGDIRQCAALENNVGNLLSDAHRFAEAHEHYASAWKLFASLNDSVHAARVDDSRAQALLAENRPGEAEEYALRGSEALSLSDDKAAYVESLITLATARARAGKGPAAWAAFEVAREVAHNFISPVAAESVSEVMLDELGPVLYRAPGVKYGDAYRRLQRSLIKRALVESNWNVSKAAFQLGMKQQGLDQLLKGTHKDVWDECPFNKT